MNVGIGTEDAQFIFWEYINWIFGTLYGALGKIFIFSGWNQYLRWQLLTVQ